jgi:flagellar hook-associated protein 1 FlgK
MAGIINIGVSALAAFKRQMETTGHNIANVNTPGYSRQVVSFDARPPQISAQGSVGSGVDVSSVQRRYDEFLATRVRDYNASYQEFSAYEQRARQIDSVLADASAGIDDMLQKFFASVNDVANDPTSIAARTVMLDRAEQLAGRFNALDGWLEDIRHNLNRDLENQVDEVNSLARSLAQVNARVTSLSGTPGGIPSDVLDERDRLIDRLSEFTSISTLEQADGAMNVFIGSGQALVVGSNYNTLGLANNAAAPDHKEIVINQAGGLTVNVTAQMSGGSLGGLLRFRDEVLDQSQNALGRVALGLAASFNEVHRSGMDLDGDLGGDFFALGAPQVLANSGNAGAGPVTVALGDVAALTTHEYELRFDGGSWTLTDLHDGSAVSMLGTGVAGDPFLADGMEIVVGAAVAGDSYRLRPTRAGASGIGLLVGNPRDIAAADPVAGGVGDNRNARRLADLQSANLMIGGTATIAGTYGALVAEVGTRTQQASSSAGVQKHLLGQAESAKSEISGVNLDEEAADLVRFQQAYQAAAQVISVANSLFDSLLAAVRR